MIYSSSHRCSIIFYKIIFNYIQYLNIIVFKDMHTKEMRFVCIKYLWTFTWVNCELKVIECDILWGMCVMMLKFFVRKRHKHFIIKLDAIDLKYLLTFSKNVYYKIFLLNRTHGLGKFNMWRFFRKRPLWKSFYLFGF